MLQPKTGETPRAKKASTERRPAPVEDRAVLFPELTSLSQPLVPTSDLCPNSDDEVELFEPTRGNLGPFVTFQSKEEWDKWMTLSQLTPGTKAALSVLAADTWPASVSLVAITSAMEYHERATASRKERDDVCSAAAGACKQMSAMSSQLGQLLAATHALEKISAAENRAELAEARVVTCIKALAQHVQVDGHKFPAAITDLLIDVDYNSLLRASDASTSDSELGKALLDALRQAKSKQET